MNEQLQAIRQAVRSILKGQPLGRVVRSTNYPDDDPCTGEYFPGGISYRPLRKKELYGVVVDELAHHPGTKPLAEYTLADLIAIYEEASESGWGRCEVLTRQQAAKEQSEAEYARMEQAAQQFADRCGHKLGSVQFIKALRQAVRQVEDQRESWNSGEARMERWAACQYAGVGSDVFFDDNNFENGRYGERLASLGDVWAYMERKFPLMMLRYKEAAARRKKQG